MRIRRLQFTNIRNHAASRLEAAPAVNVLTGLNGAGKTSVLEAIALCTLTRSFVGTPDAALMRRGERDLESTLELTSDYGVPRRIEIRYEQGAGKTISVDGSQAASAAQVIGMAPTVVLAPDLKTITSGPPVERRRFIDLVISQAKRRYLQDLIDYRRLLRQRNVLLANARRTGRGVDRTLIEPWEQGLIERGAHIMLERTRFVDEFAPIFRDTAAAVADSNEEVELHYAPDAMMPQATFEDYRDLLWLRSQQVWPEEQRRGTTMFGPHRDDLRMAIDGGDARLSASQGQHKTLLIGLKIAEFHYLRGQTAETPAILLDDIFGDLDQERARRVYELARELAQVFITVGTPGLLPGSSANPEHGDALFRVEHGTLRRVDIGSSSESPA
jgi:DNA replication and repair protein RecF